MKRLLLCFFCILLLFVTGCSSDKDTYVVKKVMIDVNGEAILRNIDKDTLEEYTDVAYVIDYIGDKIVVKDNEVIFNGSEMKKLKGVIDYDEKYDEYYINFSVLPPIIYKDSKVFDNEIRIYIPIQKKLSYLIFEKK